MVRIEQRETTESPFWTGREAIDQIWDLQGKEVNIRKVLKTHSPAHVHFADRGEIYKQPKPLQPHVVRALKDQKRPVLYREMELARAYSEYLLRHNIRGKVDIFISDSKPFEKFREAVIPTEQWSPHTVVQLFSMVDFGVRLNLSEDVQNAMKNDPSYSQFEPGRVEPWVILNTTRVEGSDLYKIDLAFGQAGFVGKGTLRTHVETCTPWYGVYPGLGIQERIDALVLLENSQSLVSALHQAANK